MIDADETLDGTWPFAPFFFGGCGFKQHYAIEPGPGDPILLLHGEPTWGYLYRKFITPLSRYGTVVVPDHMGLRQEPDAAGPRLQDPRPRRQPRGHGQRDES